MCGIHFCLKESCPTETCNCLSDNVESILRRGPDAFHSVSRTLSSSYRGHFSGSVLHLRGTSCVVQPLEDENKNVLLWNGEVFGGLEIDSSTNDTSVLLEFLSQCKEETELLSFISKIEGPWAFIFWQENKKRLWFGRDVFGRRSLLWRNKLNENQCFTLSSTAAKQELNSLESTLHYKEVPANGVYCLDLEDGDSQCFIIKMYKWQHLECSICQSELPSDNKDMNSTFLPNDNIQIVPVGMLQPPVNKCIENNLLLDQLQTYTSLLSSFTDKENSKFNAVHENSKQLYFDIMKGDTMYQTLIKNLMEKLSDAVKIRVQNHPGKCRNCLRTRENRSENSQSESCGSSTSCRTDNYWIDSIKNRNSDHFNSENCVSDNSGKCTHPKIAILFSGGIDSTLIAALADRFVPDDDPIDLLNVAFEQKSFKQTSKGRKKDEKSETSPNQSSFDVPDRISGRIALEELRQLNPKRNWQFIEIDIQCDELQRERKKRISNVIFPLTTVLDDSIGCAIWFAARGIGKIKDREGLYCSPAKVLLLGMGADEQLAGYSRHRVCFKTKGWQGLIEEIQKEVNQISSRNLGRDDRVVSDHGRESRFPFLDECVVSFLSPLAIWQKANLLLPRGVGEKFLLRLTAYELGLKKTATFEKRAIQFGSRIAKLEEKKEKGSDVCQRL